MTRKKVSEGLAPVILSAPWHPIPVILSAFTVILSVAKNLERMAWSLRFFAFVSAKARCAFGTTE
jgi:hypothetical protein